MSHCPASSIVNDSSLIAKIRNQEKSVVYLVLTSEFDEECFDRAISDIVDKSCAFVIVAGKYSSQFQDHLLDFLVEKEDLQVPFFVYENIDEGMDVFINGDIPFDGDFHKVLISASSRKLTVEEMDIFMSYARPL